MPSRIQTHSCMRIPSCLPFQQAQEVQSWHSNSNQPVNEERDFDISLSVTSTVYSEDKTLCNERGMLFMKASAEVRGRLLCNFQFSYYSVDFPRRTPNLNLNNFFPLLISVFRNEKYRNEKTHEKNLQHCTNDRANRCDDQSIGSIDHLPLILLYEQIRTV